MAERAMASATVRQIPQVEGRVPPGLYSRLPVDRNECARGLCSWRIVSRARCISSSRRTMPDQILHCGLNVC